MNTIENLKSKYPNEWDIFLDWLEYGEGRRYWYAYQHAVQNELWEIVVFILQAWLDSVGVRIEAMYGEDGYTAHYKDKHNKYWCNLLHYNTPPFATRPEALLSAVEKGMEIRKNSKQ